MDAMPRRVCAFSVALACCAMVPTLADTPTGEALGFNLLHLLPSAHFDVAADERRGPLPHRVAFKNQSGIGLPPATYAWTFGDGGDSTARAPRHTYEAAGTYTVTLTVKNALGQHTSERVNFIRVSDPNADADGDGLPNATDSDDDGDGLDDPLDAWPLDPRRTVAAGRFESYREFSGRCANPRAGANPDGNPWPDQPGSTLLENHWLRSWSNHFYLWYDEIVDAEPLGYDEPLDYFDLMRTTARTPSGRPRDRFHFTYDTNDWLALTRGGVSAGYGAAFALLAPRPPRDVRVAYTEPNSPATAAGLARGARVLEVDGVDVERGSDVDTLNAGLYPASVGETHEFVVQDLGADGRRTITMRSAEVVADPVQGVDVVPTPSGPVGYMVFNDHTGPAERELRDAVGLLASRGVADLVVDLRYNGGGYLALASQLAYMIAGPAAAQGRVFESLRFNDKHPTRNPVTGDPLEPVPFYTTTVGLPATNPVSPGEPLPTLGLSRVFVLTGGGTCSASEAVMNGLRGIDVEVVQIGATTCGKPYGFYAFDNCGTTYFSVQFQGVNAKGFGDYGDGFSPTGLRRVEGVELPGCPITDDFGHALGDVDEARFSAALEYRDTGACPATPSGSSAIAPSAADAPNGQLPRDGVVPKSLWHTNRWLHH